MLSGLKVLVLKNIKDVIVDAEKQTAHMIEQIEQAKLALKKDARTEKSAELVSPKTLNNEGKLIMVPARDWTSGFFPGVLWLLYELSGDKKWVTPAREFTSKIEGEKLNGGTHDMGFKVYCSFGTGYRATKDQEYREIIIKSAQTLSGRFNSNIGCIRSWDHSRAKWGFPVIIDNMMNLELLFAATRLTGDPKFKKIAITHANTTLKNHFRADYSSFHVVDYDTITGKKIKGDTHQGLNAGSAWSRGQAWGLYGYTVCFRETGDKKYLEQAEKIAGFILNHPNLPKDLVPYWDFNAPNIPDEPRDVSAAALMASAFYELSLYSKSGKSYRKIADNIIGNLTANYRSPIGRNKGFILLHSTGSKPHNGEIDMPLNYADYYYLEALLRKKQIPKIKF